MLKLAAFAIVVLLPSTAWAADCLYSANTSTMSIVADKLGAAIGFVVIAKGHATLECTLEHQTAAPDPRAIGWPVPIEGVCHTGPNTPATLRGEFAVVLPAPDLPPPTAIYFAGRAFYPNADCDAAVTPAARLPAEAAPRSNTSSSVPIESRKVHTIVMRPDGTIAN